MNLKIKKIATCTLLGLMLVACGGSSDSDSKESSNSSSENSSESTSNLTSEISSEISINPAKILVNAEHSTVTFFEENYNVGDIVSFIVDIEEGLTLDIVKANGTPIEAIDDVYSFIALEENTIDVVAVNNFVNISGNVSYNGEGLSTKMKRDLQVVATNTIETFTLKINDDSTFSGEILKGDNYTVLVKTKAGQIVGSSEIMNVSDNTIVNVSVNSEIYGPTRISQGNHDGVGPGITAQGLQLFNFSDAGYDQDGEVIISFKINDLSLQGAQKIVTMQYNFYTDSYADTNWKGLFIQIMNWTGSAPLVKIFYDSFKSGANPIEFFMGADLINAIETNNSKLMVIASENKIGVYVSDERTNEAYKAFEYAVNQQFYIHYIDQNVGGSWGSNIEDFYSTDFLIYNGRESITDLGYTIK